MNCYKHISIIVAALLCITLSWSMENDVHVKTSDNKKFTLPQWKIEESRLLLIKQQWQSFKKKEHNSAKTPIQLKTICSQKLRLFSQVLDAQDFRKYFAKLGSDNSEPQQELKKVQSGLSERQRLLICAAGENELDSPIITQELAKTILGLNLFGHLNSYISVTEVVDTLRSLIIRGTSFKRLPAESYPESNCGFKNCDTRTYCLPKLLVGQTNFSGQTLPALLPLRHKLTWLIDNYVETEEFVGCVTRMEAIGKKDALSQDSECKKKLWMKKKNEENAQWTEKIIEHSNEIERFLFSGNGKYLVTSSESQLVLTDLSIKDGKCIATDTLLNGCTEKIEGLYFDNQSTILAARAGRKVYFWDMNTRSCCGIIDCLGKIESMCFNRNDGDTKLAAASFYEATNDTVIVLWNIEGDKITQISDYCFKADSPADLEFSLSGDKIIIRTCHYIRLLDVLTGNMTFATEKLNKEFSGADFIKGINAVLMPRNVDILVAHSYHDDGKGRISQVSLWDIKTGKCIATLLENEKDLLGIGVSENGQSVVATTFPYKVIQIDLYNNQVAACLSWLDKEPNLLQKYLLLRLYRAFKLGDSIALRRRSPEHRILQSFQTETCNVKELVEKYFPIEKLKKISKRKVKKNQQLAQTR